MGAEGTEEKYLMSINRCQSIYMQYGKPKGKHNICRNGVHKSTLVARGADMQLDPICVSAPLATNVDLFAGFAERLFKSSFSYI